VIRIAVLGSTGSIGRSTLEIVRRHPDRFEVVALAANRSADVLAGQVAEFNPKIAALVDPPDSFTPDAGRGLERVTGSAAALELTRRDDVDVVVNAIVGAAGLEATLSALEAGKRLALANKESLVAGGTLVIDAAKRGGGELIPIDSEHSAILQCLEGPSAEEVDRLILTASGGPFRGLSAEELSEVGPEEALRHPTWSMGAKITIDSATLANKALEVIEAHFLYDISYDRIDAVIHPQSIIHSFVEFIDGSVLAQIGFPTMELPILYALTHPRRIVDTALRTFDPVRAGPLTFEPIDHDAFGMFGVGVEAGRTGGTASAVFNAANEVVVRAFLDEKLRFGDMADVVEETLAVIEPRNVEGVNDVVVADAEARATAARLINERGSLVSSMEGPGAETI
jgi:1-deoxy-D-xylulose-5-phosphate reductoisomerase